MSQQSMGEVIATSMMLRQLYVVASNAAGVGEQGLAAWRDELQQQLARAMKAAQADSDEDLTALGTAASRMLEMVFGPIT